MHLLLANGMKGNSFVSSVKRVCEECRRTFHSTEFRKRCTTCRNVKVRDCIDCKREFRGTNRICNRCRAKERTCQKCNKTYVGNGLTCSKCSGRRNRRQRCCRECGRNYLNATLKCPTCSKKECICDSCGKIFFGLHRKCYACQRKERICTSCQVCFVGTKRTCYECSKKSCVCKECNGTFRGIGRICNSCSYRINFVSLPLEAKRAVRRQQEYSRRVKLLNASTNGPISYKKLKEIRGDPCVYCGANATDLDHVRPLSRGGAHTEENLVAACGPCNKSKNARLLLEWKAVDKVVHAIGISPKIRIEVKRILDQENI